MSQNGGSVLSVQNITRNFGGLVAVNDVSFSVNKDEIFGLIGPNGAGKTPLFNIITGLTAPSRGALVYKGADYTAARPDQIPRQGFARTFQNIRLFSSLTALENVMIARHIHTHTNFVLGVFALPPDPAEERRARDRAEEHLVLVGLADRLPAKAPKFANCDHRTQ